MSDPVEAIEAAGAELMAAARSIRQGKPSPLARAFAEAVEKGKPASVVPLFDHVAGEAECFHRPSTLGEPKVGAAEVLGLLREQNARLATPVPDELLRAMASDPEVQATAASLWTATSRG